MLDYGKGLSSGGKLQETIWHEFINDKPRLKAVASAIRERLSLPDIATITPVVAEISETVEAPEGKVLFREHAYRERNQSLSRKKKALVKKQTGKLCCEVCGFSFAEVYGELGEDCIECHHNKPVSQLKPGETTKLSDLSLVYANCHRMLHRGGELLSISELRKIVEANGEERH